MATLEERGAKLEGSLEQINVCLNRIETEIAELRREMQSNFRTLVGLWIGTLIPVWVTIILAIVFTR